MARISCSRDNRVNGIETTLSKLAGSSNAYESSLTGVKVGNRS